ncbi:AEC family transporter [Leptolyngbya sp. AN02str]|uniref:AEC family transporter n=1 Tax=Leptolyngbya sp. AN02str TaxID=3423363 RepID=UPI003D323266
MTDTLIQAYLPLLLWTGLGVLSFRWLPESLPRWLGRALYWVGVPIQIFTLARGINTSEQVGLVPYFAGMSVLLGLGLASVAWAIAQWVATRAAPPAEAAKPEDDPLWTNARKGSFVLASMLGNTGFVGLAIAPNFVDESYLGWLVLYSVTQNVVGTYGIGVFVSSYFGRSQQTHWLGTLRDMLTVPSLWAFTLGFSTRHVGLPSIVESGLHSALWIVIPCALLLMGIRLRQLQGWQSLKRAIIPVLIKVVTLPLIIGTVAVCIDLPPNPKLAMVLMAGMPTAFAGLILAEEYELDRDLIASSIVLTTIAIFITLPIWLLLFQR